VVEMSVVPSAELDGATGGKLRDLWQAAFGDDFDEADAEHAHGGIHAVLRDGPVVLAHASVVPRTLIVGESSVRVGYVEAVATLPSHQGRGLATRAMTALDPVLRRDHDMGALSTGIPAFYARLGWERWRGPSYVVRDGEWVRTEEDDDGLMVLRYGVSAGLELTLPIACGDRSGDVW